MSRKMLLFFAAGIIAVALPGSRAGVGASLPQQPTVGIVSNSSASESLPSESCAGTVALRFPTGEGATDEERTVASLTKAAGTEHLYLMTYYGNYGGLVKEKNAEMTDGYQSATTAGCTLISMTGNRTRPVYGRNFDNPPGTDALLALYRPKGKYSSIAFSRLDDLGLSGDFNVRNLNDSQKKSLLVAPFYTTDGVNEKGLAVSIAYNPPGVSTKGFKGESVFITNLMRTILDNAADVDEAVRICRVSKAFDFGIDKLSHHFLIADARADSVIAEFSGGDWRFLRNDAPYQVVTNIPLYQVPEKQRRADCWRYRTASDLLAAKKGKGDWKDMLSVLNAVHQGSYTIWSYAANLKAGELYLCMNSDFSKVFEVSFS